MTTNMRREAKESPDCVAKFLESETTGIEKLAQAMRSSPGGACLTVARGSSDCAAAYFSTAMALLTGRLVTSLPPSLVSVYHAPLNFGDAWLVAFSQSGQSPDLLAVAHAFGAKNLRTAALCASSVVLNSWEPSPRATKYWVSPPAGCSAAVIAARPGNAMGEGGRPGFR